MHAPSLSRQISRACGIVAVLTCVSGPAAARSQIVISQVYGGGGMPGSAYKADFVELFNRGEKPVDIAGWALRTWCSTCLSWAARVTPLTGSIPAGGYYLIQMGSPASGRFDLPAPDAVLRDSLPVAGIAVALFRKAVDDLVGCPPPSRAADLVGIGDRCPCVERSSAAGHSLTTATLRVGDGCRDTDDNTMDFVVDEVTPHNSSSPVRICTLRDELGRRWRALTREDPGSGSRARTSSTDGS